MLIFNNFRGLTPKYGNATYGTRTPTNFIMNPEQENEEMISATITQSQTANMALSVAGQQISGSAARTAEGHLKVDERDANLLFEPRALDRSVVTIRDMMRQKRCLNLMRSYSA